MSGNENIKYLIVPDVHGRDFWREPVYKTLQETDTKIIFLGDYVDPYYGEFYDGDEDKWLVEGINSWENLSDYVVKTLTDIIELKKQYPESNVPRAREVRRTLTPWERKLWYLFLNK